MFVDSSALVAMLAPEPDGQQYAVRLDEAREPATSSIHVFEACLALRKLRNAQQGDIILLVEEFLRRANIRVMEIESDDHIGALHAFEKYGKGTGHPAQLNMGDCFAYAVAKRLGTTLLYKGDDFAHTDLA